MPKDKKTDARPNETTVSLQDYFTNKNLLYLKNEINIIGRIESIIDYSMYKK